MDKFDFGNNLYYIRRAKGISQEAMAISLDISQTRYSRIERNLVIPDLEMIYKIAAILEVSSSVLISGTGDANMDDANQLMKSESEYQAKNFLYSRIRFLTIFVALVIFPNWLYEMTESFCIGLGTSYQVMTIAKWTVGSVVFCFILYLAWKMKQKK
jgi:transcriptional regulator with XRE-family HTH domain